MKVEKIELGNTNAFSSFFLDYISSKESLSLFYGRKAQIESFEGQIAEKNFEQQKREVLHKVLSEQYDDLDTSAPVQTNTDALLDENTFTVTTGHQLNIFTGPLYFIYKIVTVINACKALKAKYPEKNFVPVYWMASEDHDFEEINHFSLFGKKYAWNCDQKGAVGRFSTDSIQDLLSELPEKVELFERAYTSHKQLVDAVRCYINDLFGDYGVIAMDADDRRLKAQFSEVVEDDILNHHANDLVEETSSKLSSLDYHAQVFPRAINFFYMDGDIRERIVKGDAQWKVLNTDLTFSEEQIKQLIRDEPEKFSPNVVMRPLYQEMILPNLAYCGGPAEVVYWMQLKRVFEYYQTPFPILMPRNFALIVNKAVGKKMQKFEFSNEDIFLKEEVLKEIHLRSLGDGEIDLSEERRVLQTVFEGLTDKANSVDGSLKGFIGAENSKALRCISAIEKRLKKANEQKNESALNQISALKSKLFPNGSLQERHDNFLNFYINNPEFISELVNLFDPFDYSFNMLKDE
ncbi:MAG: bacillithiol biosynthesis cysteine-adding enzyme BshC [Cyclobacteriaceae bacterium]